MNKVIISNGFDAADGVKILEFARDLADTLELSRFVDFELDDQSKLEQINSEWKKLAILQDAKRRRELEHNPEFRSNMLEVFGSEESALACFTDILNMDLQLIEPDFDSEFDKYMQDSEDIEDIPEEMADIKSGTYISERDDFKSKNYSRISRVDMGPIFEISSFDLATTFEEILEQLQESLFVFPLVFDGYYFENPALVKDDRAILAISSNSGFASLELTDEELEDFKALDIPFDYAKEELGL